MVQGDILNTTNMCEILRLLDLLSFLIHLKKTFFVPTKELEFHLYGSLFHCSTASEKQLVIDHCNLALVTDKVKM